MRYFGFIFLGWLMTGLAYLGWYVASLGFSSSPEIMSIAGWYAVKESAMKRTEGESRIVLFGGSSGLFGVRMSDVEKELGVPCVNFAVHAGLPSHYLIQRLQANLSPGDTVLYSPEYESYLPSPDSELFVRFISGGDAGYFGGMPRSEQLRWAFGASGRTLWGTVQRFLPGERKKAKASFESAMKDLNLQGDYTQNDPTKRTQAAAENLENSLPLGSVRTDLANSGQPWSRIERFLSWCRDRDILVMAMFPPTIRHPEYDDPEVVVHLDALVAKWRSLGVEVIGTPKDSMHPREWFFDTLYHLNSEGMSKHTRMVIEGLRKAGVPAFP